jgi:hypothetical protein
MKKLLPLLLILLIYKTANAQSADSTLKRSPVKTYSDKQYNALLMGEDLYDMALPAELNHNPLPDKVLKYKRQIDLSPIQITKITALDKELHRKKLEMGLIIIKNERTLDSLFKYNVLDNGTLLFFANRSGLYYGELRNAILQACYATRHLISDEQNKKLWALHKGN